MATVSKLEALGLWMGAAGAEAIAAPANDEVARDLYAASRGNSTASAGTN